MDGYGFSGFIGSYSIFLVNKVQAILQKLIKNQLFIVDILRKGVYIHHILTESRAEIGYKTGNKENFSPYT